MLGIICTVPSLPILVWGTLASGTTIRRSRFAVLSCVVNVAKSSHNLLSAAFAAPDIPQ
jgi:hypothetical protein